MKRAKKRGPGPSHLLMLPVGGRSDTVSSARALDRTGSSQESRGSRGQFRKTRSGCPDRRPGFRVKRAAGAWLDARLTLQQKEEHSQTLSIGPRAERVLTSPGWLPRSRRSPAFGPPARDRRRWPDRARRGAPVSRTLGRCKHLEAGPGFGGGLPVAAQSGSLASVSVKQPRSARRSTTSPGPALVLGHASQRPRRATWVARIRGSGRTGGVIGAEVNG